MNELKEQIKNKNFECFYLFYGKEEYIKKKYEKAIKASMMDESQAFMNYDYFDEKNALPDKIKDSCETLPFLCDRRLVIVKNSGFFMQGKKEESKTIAEYITNIPLSTTIIFIEKEVDKRGILFKTALKTGKCIEFKAPDQNSLISWIVSWLKKYKINITSGMAVYFLRTVGSNMDCIENELKKLAAFKGENNEILKDDIDNICTKSFEAKIFELVEAIGKKNTSAAVTIYKNMILLKESPFSILSMITRQFKLILQCGVLNDKGFSLENIGERLSIHTFVIKECIIQWRNFNERNLKYAINDCLEAELNSKTGFINIELAVELLIIKYSTKDRV